MAAPRLTEAPAVLDAPAPVLPVSIAGIGGYLPDEVVTNDDLSERLDTSDDWIRSRTGIRERRVARGEQRTSDLAVPAARRALRQAGVRPVDLGAVVVATCTPDHQIPGTAPIVAARLGTPAPAFDLNAACSGFLYGLQVGGSLVATGLAPVLLIGSETITHVVDPDDRTTAVLFGDGAGAVVLTETAEPRLGPFDLGADGSDPSMLWIAPEEQYLSMRGGEIYRRAVAAMAASSQRVLDAAGLAVEDVDLMVGHQANERILDAAARRLGLDPVKSHLSVDRHGNTSAASIPLALADAVDKGVLRDGHRVLLTAFGAGLTWGSCLLTWTEEGAR